MNTQPNTPDRVEQFLDRAIRATAPGPFPKESFIEWCILFAGLCVGICVGCAIMGRYGALAGAATDVEGHPQPCFLVYDRFTGRASVIGNSRYAAFGLDSTTFPFDRKQTDPKP